MSSPYRRVLSIPGAVAFSVTGLVARLPISMAGLGIVLLVTAQTGSYSEAGRLSAAYIAAEAIGAVPLARLVDRRGQSAVLGPAVTVSVAAMGLLVVAVEQSWPTPWPHLCAVVSGATMPNIGSAIRARWTHVVKDRSQLDTAFSVEAVMDEAVFMIGPTAATLLATAVAPQAGLVTAGAAALVGTWVLVLQRRTEPPSHLRRHEGRLPRMPWLALAPVLVGSAMLGVLFGGSEVAVVAFAEEAGHKAIAGPLLAVWALGSLISGVISGGLTFRRSPQARYRLGVLALALLMVPMPFVSSTALLGVFLFLAGFAISPTLIGAVSWVEVMVPAARLNEGMTAMTTGLVLGVAPGAALVGSVVDAHGASPAFWVPAAAGLVGAAVAQWRSDAPARLPAQGSPLS